MNWATNQITPTGVSYDGNGNVTTVPPSETLGYDVANRLVTVNGTQTYAYDSSNQRAYRNDGQDMISLYGAFGEKLAVYQISGFSGGAIQDTGANQNVYFGAQLISAENSAVAVDRLGSTRWAAGGTFRTYYPYGVEYSATSNDTEKYATYFRDSTVNLDYAVNRYYSSIWGRFISPDPYSATATLPGEPTIPLSWNRYAYTLNDPINLYDPAGENYCAPIPNYDWLCPFSSGLVSGDASDGDFGSIDYGLTTVAWFPGDDDGNYDDYDEGSGGSQGSCEEAFGGPSSVATPQLAVLLGENSWGFASTSAVSIEDLYMEIAMDNQAKPKGFGATSASVDATINQDTYHGFSHGLGVLISDLTSSSTNSNCTDLTVAEAAYDEFWGGGGPTSNVNRWRSASNGPPTAGQFQIAQTVFYYAAGSFFSPTRRIHSRPLPIDPLPRRPAPGK